MTSLPGDLLSSPGSGMVCVRCTAGQSFKVGLHAVADAQREKTWLAPDSFADDDCWDTAWSCDGSIGARVVSAMTNALKLCQR